MSALATSLQAWFTDRLIRERNASPHTIASYRDTIRLLLTYASHKLGVEPSSLELNQLDAPLNRSAPGQSEHDRVLSRRVSPAAGLRSGPHRTPPSRLQLEDLNAPLIVAFLEHLERERHSSARTRNARLAAVHSLFRFAALAHPEHAELIARVLAIPPKRADRTVVTFLTDPEVDALLDAPNRSSWLGRRDHALLLLAIQTGLRVSELTSLQHGDVSLVHGAHVRCQGKGRKERMTPLTTETVQVLREWLIGYKRESTDPLFPASHGGQLSRDAIERLLTRHAKVAALTCPTLTAKRVSPHVLRHTSAMRLLHAGVDSTVIALWLGHESTRTTDIYLHADLTLKQRAIDRTAPPGTRPGRYRPPDSLLAFLKGL